MTIPHAPVGARSYELLQRGGRALVGLLDAIGDAKPPIATADRLAVAPQLQRRPLWWLVFVAIDHARRARSPR